MRVALAGATLDEARAVMVEGVSGLLQLARPGEIEAWNRADGVLRFANGAEATLFSGASPERFRGPEHDFAWCDEIAKWAHPRESWDNLQLGLRRGANPQAVVTTTPRGGGFIEALLAEPGTVLTRGSTADNPFTPAAFKEAMTARYGGTRLGAQELDGVLLTDVEGSLWPGKLLESRRHRAAPGPFGRVVIGVDPPASVNGTCGIVVCGVSTSLDANGEKIACVLADASVSGASPEGWARAVVAAAEAWGADRVIAEVNQGGDMVRAVLRAASVTLPVRTVRAVRGKARRAEPVAALFEEGRAWFAGRFPELEAELGGLTIGGDYRGAGSPDRADAMVWALWALMLEPERAEPRIRVL